jgi:hypothetical protein
MPIELRTRRDTAESTVISIIIGQRAMCYHGRGKKELCRSSAVVHETLEIQLKSMLIFFRIWQRLTSERPTRQKERMICDVTMGKFDTIDRPRFKLHRELCCNNTYTHTRWYCTSNVGHAK